MDINEAVAKAISAERSAAGLTIKDLAKKSGVPERTLIRVLKNERDIKVNQVAQLCDVFGIMPHELMVTAEEYILREERGASALSDEERVHLTLQKVRQRDQTLAALHDANMEEEKNDDGSFA